MPDPFGLSRGSVVPRAKASAGAVYSLATRVRNAFGGRALARSYSLPRVVEP